MHVPPNQMDNIPMHRISGWLEVHNSKFKKNKKVKSNQALSKVDWGFVNERRK